jgi:hypothetical protein
MKKAHSQVAEKPAVYATRDSAKVRIGAMTPSFPPEKQPAESSNECDKGR